MKAWLPFVLVAAIAVVPVSGTPEAASSQSSQALSPPPRPAAPGVAGVPGGKPWPDAAGMAERKREAERRRLFRSDDPFPVTLTADFRAVMRDRNPKSTVTYPATISFPKNDGTEASMPLRIRTRGHSRRNPVTCSFAPLRLEFDKALSKGTIFDGHGALKLGTHCRKGAEEVIVREYAMYRMFNLLTPRSFRARLANLKYVDVSTSKVVAEETGLFIEDDDDVAKRMEARIIELPQALFARVDQDTLSLMMLFEFMIGNTDFSLIVQHNIRILQTQDGRRYPVPYDFDYSGLADSGYGVPARGLPITDVRDRLYRGPCRTPAEWQPFVDKFKAAKPDLLAIFATQPGLGDGYRRQAKQYLESFYKVLDHPSTLKKELIESCIKTGV